MFTKEFFEVLAQIVKSWQVIAAAIVIFLYLNIVSYVSRSYHPPRVKRVKKIKQKGDKAETVPAPDEEKSYTSSNDELGLEEA